MYKRTIDRRIRNAFRTAISAAPNGVADRDRILENTELIRRTCRTVLDAGKEFSECPVDQNKRVQVLTDAESFCTERGLPSSEEQIDGFLLQEKESRVLSYSEIACLIPSLMLVCTEFYCRGIRSAENMTKALKTLSEYDGSDLFSRLSETDKVLREDSCFRKLTPDSKNEYRNAIRKIAKRKKISERTVAVELLKKARKEQGNSKMEQIGSLLFRPRNNPYYFPVLFALTTAGILITAIATKQTVTTIFSLIPAFSGAKALCDFIFSKTVSRCPLPKIEITEENCPKSLLTVVSLLRNEKDAKKLLHRLEVLSYRVPITNIKIGLLLDLPKASEELSDKEKILVEAIVKEIEDKNKIDNRFFIAIRKRKRTESYEYEARGRKQGAILDFTDAILNESNAFYRCIGDLKNGKYLIPLDEDTEPELNAVERLIGFMEHPNHLPETETDRKGAPIVVAGYGAAAPRITPNPTTSHTTPFSTHLAGNPGTEFYHAPCFDLYQDLFSEGSFCGKGILNVECYNRIVSARFREKPLLSHDLPEGYYLRCADLSDTVFFDDIPRTVIADRKRTHRWIRGDVQNLKFLFSKNSAFVFRFKLFHNLIRALHPIACLALFLSAPLKGIAPALTAMAWMATPYVLLVPSLLHRWLFRNLYTKPSGEPLRALRSLVFDILFLPTDALIAADAIGRSTVRMIRQKNLLEWTTSAGISVKADNVGIFYESMKGQTVGFPLLFFPVTFPLGIAWLLAPAVAYRISQKRQRHAIDRTRVRSELSALWSYYEDLQNEEENFLPPDNLQIEPAKKIAHRTSPTNIGFSLLSVLGALDLQLIEEEKALTFLEKAVTTVEKLPKWNGLLYNWYDTRTLEVLPPQFVSTVDCGNWAASLHALSNGLEELRSFRAKALASRIQRLLQDADFRLLYDRKKNLFRIGYNVSADQPDRAHYDLFASEALLTSYYGIMTGQIPMKHWNALSRPIRIKNGNWTIPSWSGTCFEYFMPNLLLPAYRNTLYDVLLQNVSKRQITVGRGEIPWGISESGYYAFDEEHNYQYRAFGLRNTAQRRDVSFPAVISTYSTFLTYYRNPEEAEQNLQKLPKGKYGYYEAVDYRLGNDRPRIVKSFMAHHVGMSFLAGVNLLCDGIMQRRFLQGRGEAFASLLAEPVPERGNTSGESLTKILF